jgi:hypothetical protein
MEPETLNVLEACNEIERAIRLHPHDGLIYEDVYVKVERKDGKVFMSGQPIREPFIYLRH